MRTDEQLAPTADRQRIEAWAVYKPTDAGDHGGMKGERRGREASSAEEWLARDRAAAEGGRRQAAEAGRAYATPIDLAVEIDPGAPVPHVVADGRRAVVVYHSPLPVDSTWDGTTVTVIDPADPTARGLGWIICDRIRAVSLGPPDDETLSSHPLFAAGLRCYQAHEIYDPGLDPGVRRLVVTFHDETFDCTCIGWESGELVTDFRTALALATRAVREGAESFADRRIRSAGMELDPTRLSCVQLFRRREVLDRAVGDAREAGWSIVRFDAGRWAAEADVHMDLAAALSFPDYYGRNLDALNDCMHDVISGEYGFSKHAIGGLVVIDAFDQFHRQEPRVAHVLLEILGEASVGALRHRWQLATFLRVDDPEFAPAPFAAQTAIWNLQEWLRAKRVE